MSLDNLSKDIIRFEGETDILDKTIQGVHFWQLLRFDLFQMLAKERGLFQDAHPRLKNRKNRFRHFFLNTRDMIKRAPPLRPHKTDFMILPHARKINGKDIYTNALYDILKHKPHMVFYPRSIDGMEDDAKVFGWQSLYYNICNIIFNRTGFLPLQFSANEEALIQNLEHEFQQRLNSKAPLANMIKRQIFRFHIFYKAYTRLLKKTRPDKIIMVTAYSQMPLIAAARDLGIPTYEVQHGTISTNHMGYYYPHCEAPPYMPDTLLAHGSFWTRKPPLPKSIKTEIIGAAHVSAIQSPNPKTKNQILFFSQGTVAADLFPFAQQVAKAAPDYHIIYRLHPSEIADDYTSPDIANFEIRHGGDGFFDDLTGSEFIATVYSTTIYEAMACGAKAIVAGLNGHNAVQDIIDNGDAVLAKTPDDFVKALTTAKPCSTPEKYYAPFDAGKVTNIFSKSA